MTLTLASIRSLLTAGALRTAEDQLAISALMPNLFFEVLLASVSSFVVNSSGAIPTEQWHISSNNSFMFQTAAVAVAFVPW